MIVSEITLYNTLREKLGDQVAQVVVEGIKSSVKDEFENKKEFLATKQDLGNLKSELLKTIYIVGLGQLLAIVAAVVAIVNFMSK